MRHVPGGVAFALLLAVCAAARPALAGPKPSAQRAATQLAALERIADDIGELRLEDAERALAKLAAGHPEMPEVLFEQARLAFYRGQYAAAVTLADRALASVRGRERRSWQGMRELMADTLAVTRGFERAVSSDGRYDVLYPAGKDALLAHYALDVLASADRALERVFGVHLPSPIRLEIYPSPETLAEVSALTVEQIETTGTVALSKWNRLMITSPKALVRGYPWADTITHEMVHLVLSRLTGERAPVWLQEGTAKLFERAWRARASDLVLDKAAQGLLHSAHAKGKLLTFEQMHPSIAMLPSEEDAALAFAQVSTFMQLFVQRHGHAALRAALAQIERGVDAREALSSAAGLPFAKLESEWKASLPAAPDGPAPRRLATRFRTGDGPNDESSEVVEDEARKYLRVGDLLWDRGRAAAAAREYEKAHNADRQDPIAAARWARAALETGNPNAAVQALAPHIESYPAHAPTHALLGSARLLLGEREAAREELREAILINPFDPDPHCDLVRASDDPTEVERERRACGQLK
jgi:tetratricopeptide (TPR) repeat protein